MPDYIAIESQSSNCEFSDHLCFLTLPHPHRIHRFSIFLSLCLTLAWVWSASLVYGFPSGFWLLDFVLNWISDWPYSVVWTFYYLWYCPLDIGFLCLEQTSPDINYQFPLHPISPGSYLTLTRPPTLWPISACYPYSPVSPLIMFKAKSVWYDSFLVQLSSLQPPRNWTKTRLYMTILRV